MWQCLVCCCSGLHKLLLDQQDQTLKHSQKTYHSYTFRFEYIKNEVIDIANFFILPKPFFNRWELLSEYKDKNTQAFWVVNYTTSHVIRNKGSGSYIMYKT